jgi:hypothetical protein
MTERPPSIIITLAALVLLSITSVGGGAILLDDPSGRSMGIESIIQYVPFGLQDFHLVSIWLIVVFGILPPILAAGIWFRKKLAWNGAIGLGAVVMAWILAEVFLFYSLGFVFFYPLIGGIGVIIVAALSLRSTKRYFGN